MAFADTAESSGFDGDFPSTTALPAVVLCLVENSIATIYTAKQLLNLIFTTLSALFHVGTR